MKMIQPVKKIICYPGCICCVCVARNENLNKKFNDTVVCYQENGKCVKINNTEYVLVEIEEDGQND